MSLFEVVIIHEECEKDDRTYEEEFVFGPKMVMAGDEQKAAMETVLTLEKDVAAKLDRRRMKVLVRPF